MSRVVLCGSDASGRKTLAALLKNTPVHSPQVSIAVGQDSRRRAQVLAREAIASDIAILVVDAQVGLTSETRRHVHILVALNLERLVVASDNVGERSLNMNWYSGPLLFDSVGPDEKSKEQTPGNCTSAHQFEAAIVWTSDRPMLQSRSYLMQVGTTLVSATVAPLKYRIDSHTLQPVPSKTLACGDVGVCNLELATSITGLRKARQGLLQNFTGVDSPYEEPEHPELRLDTTRLTAESCAQEIRRHLERMGIVESS